MDDGDASAVERRVRAVLRVAQGVRRLPGFGRADRLRDDARVSRAGGRRADGHGPAPVVAAFERLAHEGRELQQIGRRPRSRRPRTDAGGSTLRVRLRVERSEPRTEPRGTITQDFTATACGSIRGNRIWEAPIARS